MKKEQQKNKQTKQTDGTSEERGGSRMAGLLDRVIRRRKMRGLDVPNSGIVVVFY